MKKQTDMKARLMDVAIELIWESNYSNVGVAEICKQAGVTKGCFYHHFETKADLFYEASQHYWQGMKPTLEEVVSPACSPLEQVENLIRLVIKIQVDRAKEGKNPVSGCPFFSAGSQVGTGEEKVRQASIEMSDKAIQYTTSMVRGLKAEGCLEGDPNPSAIARRIHQYIMGLLMHGRALRDLSVVKADLREALYGIMGLKPSYRIEGPEMISNQMFEGA